MNKQFIIKVVLRLVHWSLSVITLLKATSFGLSHSHWSTGRRLATSRHQTEYSSSKLWLLLLIIQCSKASKVTREAQILAQKFMGAHFPTQGWHTSPKGFSQFQQLLPTEKFHPLQPWTLEHQDAPVTTMELLCAKLCLSMRFTHFAFNITSTAKFSSGKLLAARTA